MTQENDERLETRSRHRLRAMRIVEPEFSPNRFQFASPIKRERSAGRRDLGSAAIRHDVCEHREPHRVTPFDAPQRRFLSPVPLFRVQDPAIFRIRRSSERISPLVTCAACSHRRQAPVVEPVGEPGPPGCEGVRHSSRARAPHPAPRHQASRTTPLKWDGMNRNIVIKLIEVNS